jgi:hypothetical protein
MSFFSPIVTFVESRKFWTAFLAFVFMLIPLYNPSLPVWYNPLIGFLGAIGVFAIPNEPKIPPTL